VAGLDQGVWNRTTAINTLYQLQMVVQVNTLDQLQMVVQVLIHDQWSNTNEQIPQSKARE